MLLFVTALVAGCFPAFDWRESRPEGSGAALMFPCRPDRQQRTVRVGATTVPMQLHSCKAAEVTFSLSVVDAADPLRVSPLVAALRQHAVSNVGGTASLLPLPTIGGATPNPQSRFLRIEGRLPDGRGVVVHAAFFVKGLRVYQATVVGRGETPAGEPLATFFNSIRLP